MDRSAFILLPCLLLACSSGPPDPRTDDTPTRGDVVVLADQDFRSIIDAQQKVFEHFYPKARLRLYYLSEADLLQAMMSDSVRLAFTACLPGAEQQRYYQGRNIRPEIVPILVDGLVAVVSDRSARQRIRLEEIKQRLAGSSGSKILVDDMRTGVVRSLADSLFGGDGTKLRGAAVVSGIDQLMARVREDTAALGLISYAQISDLDDPNCVDLRRGIRLVPIAGTDTLPAVGPTQGTLADGRYPLRRRVCAVLVEGRSGLGTGFVAFVAGHKGQRIILRSGLAPHKVPSREVMIVNE